MSVVYSFSLNGLLHTLLSAFCSIVRARHDLGIHHVYHPTTSGAGRTNSLLSCREIQEVEKVGKKFNNFETCYEFIDLVMLCVHKDNAASFQSEQQATVPMAQLIKQGRNSKMSNIKTS